ncbi:MAG: 16S rRNA (adenine(1518)-N(6)/adenine(1519)-N(6))-dimethyltransferase RsmA [Bacilli bacterium]|nr:16S rRNA (adenine(1518)-N(6)/adenine(1519)-N(6))-dimethyltransferase RsmA [Bacilli bacterium]
MIGSIKETKEILEKYKLKARKSFGQNFLVDSNIINKIVTSAGLTKQDGVIEIGPGIGAMTEVMLEKTKKVLCYEIDSNMTRVLREEINSDDLIIKEEDFLKADINKDLENFVDCERVLVISNLPYYITTPIIFKLLECENRIDEFYFMVQKEVGARLTGKPKTKDYNSLSVLIEYQADAQLLFDVKRNCFYPAPDVDSVIIKLKKVKREYEAKNRGLFVKFVQDVFAMRRKTFINNLLNKYPISRENITTQLRNYGFSETLRAEELTTRELVDMFNVLF